MQRPVAVVEAIHPYGVVEIARRFPVNGHDIEGAEVAPAGDFSLRNRTRNRLRLRQHVIRKAVRDMVRADQDLDVDPKSSGWPRISVMRPWDDPRPCRSRESRR